VGAAPFVPACDQESDFANFVGHRTRTRARENLSTKKQDQEQHPIQNQKQIKSSYSGKPVFSDLLD
jgi:hypothetical protein